MVTASELLDVPTMTEPKFSVVAERETVPVPDAEPVPVRLTVCGEPVALSVNASPATWLPVVVGLK
jgi:hypothetical protein